MRFSKAPSPCFTLRMFHPCAEMCEKHRCDFSPVTLHWRDGRKEKWAIHRRSINIKAGVVGRWQKENYEKCGTSLHNVVLFGNKLHIAHKPYYKNSYSFKILSSVSYNIHTSQLNMQCLFVKCQYAPLSSTCAILCAYLVSKQHGEHWP